MTVPPSVSPDKQKFRRVLVHLAGLTRGENSQPPNEKTGTRSPLEPSLLKTMFFGSYWTGSIFSEDMFVRRYNS